MSYLLDREIVYCVLRSGILGPNDTFHDEMCANEAARIYRDIGETNVKVVKRRKM